MSKTRTPLPFAIVLAVCLLARLSTPAFGDDRAADPSPDAGMPHLRKQGSATQLVVDGKPLLLLAGELHNSSASSLAYMEPVWPRLKALHLNAVLATASWELLEPEEGKFDFALTDGLIEAAPRTTFAWSSSGSAPGRTPARPTSPPG